MFDEATQHGTRANALLEQAEIHAKAQGQIFVGLYVGNELLEDTTIPLAMVKVADALRKEFPRTLVLVVSSVLSGNPRRHH